MSIYDDIIKDKQIKKFCAYGFLKNLKFFEPYLLIYFIGFGMSLFQIGLLFSIREIIVYIFEVPSGLIADHYGKKRELMMCFTFYIVSFVFFFIGASFFILAIGMVFYGLGEAFRSGTHKAMIFSYLERNDWFDHKTFVYGRTRSFSLIGSSISAFLSILFILNLPAMRWIFLISTIPYVLDFVLIATYPDFLDERRKTAFKWKDFFNLGLFHITSIWKQRDLLKVIVSSSTYDGISSIIKDYIQPILLGLLLGSTALAFIDVPTEDLLTICLGTLYGIFYIFSSLASRNVYRLNIYATSGVLMNRSYDITAVVLIVIGFFIHQSWMLAVILLYFTLYLMKDARRPIFVDLSGSIMKREERATALSVEAQLKSLSIIILGPLLGLIADHFSIQLMFVALGSVMLLASRFIKVPAVLDK